jgi:hypothetical protein
MQILCNNSKRKGLHGQASTLIQPNIALGPQRSAPKSGVLNRVRFLPSSLKSLMIWSSWKSSIVELIFFCWGGEGKQFSLSPAHFCVYFLPWQAPRPKPKVKSMQISVEKLWNFKWVNHHRSSLLMRPVCDWAELYSLTFLTLHNCWHDGWIAHKDCWLRAEIRLGSSTICKLHSVSHILSLWKTSLYHWSRHVASSIIRFKLQMPTCTLNEIQP